ncbi:MAG: glycoside hydrolase family 16 protein [Pleurocapsa minor GSE-CHR-MK-17-07R]|nr:glycoside hydrolase family 16 protein [Pleurocapsa minor GSE-CHR-MK 17-07R]
MSTADFPANPLHKPGYVLEFNDAFEGPAIDTAKWVPYYLPQWSSRAQTAPRHSFGPGGFALHIDVDQPPWCPEFDGQVKCSSIQTGVYSGPVGSTAGQHGLRLNAIVREAQPTIRTYTPQYGYFEVRCRAVAAQGNVSALWMIGFEENPVESGEIAIFEVFGEHATPTQSEVRYGVHPWQDDALKDEFYREVLSFDATAFHIYAAEWTPTHIDFYIDNVKRQTIRQSPAYPMQFMLGLYELPGAAHDSAAYPKRFVVDYFRGYQSVGGYQQG